MKRLDRKFVATALLFWVVLCTSAVAGDKAPIPAKLAQAKTALLENDGVSLKTFDALYQEFKKWNRFRIVESKEDAEVIATLSMKRGLLGSKWFYLSVKDAKDDTSLWGDSADEGVTAAAPAKKLVSRLRERMEKK